MKTIEISETVTDLRYIKFVAQFVAQYQRDPSSFDGWEAATEEAFKEAALKAESPANGSVPANLGTTNTPSPQLLALVAIMRASATVSTTAVLKVIYDEFPQLRA